MIKFDLFPDPEDIAPVPTGTDADDAISGFQQTCQRKSSSHRASG